jgi:hypothetical protein
MDLPSIDDIDVTIRKFIDKAKENGGYLMVEDLDVHVFNNLAKRKMLSHGLIVKSLEKDWQYDLTQKGWEFKGFKQKPNYERWQILIAILSVIVTLAAAILSIVF